MIAEILASSTFIAASCDMVFLWSGLSKALALPTTADRQAVSLSRGAIIFANDKDDLEFPWSVAVVAGFCGHPEDQSLANARLIAAAPELVEALKPFDRLGAIILAEAPPEARTVVVFTSATGEKFSMELDYFRRARAALSRAGVTS